MPEIKPTTSVISARIHLETMATIVDYFRQNGEHITKGEVPAFAIDLLAENLIRSGRGRRFSKDEAVMFFDLLGWNMHKGGRGKATLHNELVEEERYRNLLEEAANRIERKRQPVDVNEELKAILRQSQEEAIRLAQESGTLADPNAPQVEKPALVRLSPEEAARHREEVLKKYRPKGGE